MGKCQHPGDRCDQRDAELMRDRKVLTSTKSRRRRKECERKGSVQSTGTLNTSTRALERTREKSARALERAVLGDSTVSIQP